MNHCVQCGSRIPDGQRTCSMCYGDPDHGRDGYYKDYLNQQAEQWAREEQEREQQPDQDKEF